MPYIVINKFIDQQNNNTLYKVGDQYPKGNYKPSKKRIEELSKPHPKHKCIFIKKQEQVLSETGNKE